MAEQLTLEQVLQQVGQFSDAQTQNLRNKAAEQFTAAANIKANAMSNPLSVDAEYRTVQSMAETLAAQAAAGNESIDFAVALGLRGEEALTVKAGLDMQQSFQQALALGKQIDQIESQSFFDNPLEWISNRVIGNPIYQEHNAAVKKFNTINDGMNAMNARAQQFAQTAQSTMPGLSVEAQKTKVDALNSKLAQMKNELHVASNQFNAEAYSTLAAADGLQLRSILEAKSLQYEATRLALQKEANDRAAVAATDKTDKTEEDAILQYYQAAHLNWYGKEDTTADVKTLMRLYAAKGNPASDRVRALVEHGMQLMSMPMQDAGQELQGSFGFTPATAYNNIAAAKIPLAPAAKQTYESLILPSVQTAFDPVVGKDLKTPEQRMAYVNQQVIKRVADYNSLINDKDKTNPYIIQPLKFFTSTDGSQHKEVTKTQLWQKVFAPAIVQGKLVETNHQEIFNLTAAAIEQKIVSADQAAADLATIVGYSSALNASLKQFRRFGLPDIGELPYTVRVQYKDPDIVGVTATILGMPAVTSSPEDMFIKVNLKNGNEIKRALLLTTSAKARLQDMLGMPVTSGKKGK